MRSEEENFIIVHSEFRLNREVHTVGSLKALATQYGNQEEQYLKAIGSFIIDWLDDKDFVVVQTSGSTGKAKKISIQKSVMVNSALATAKRFDVFQKTKALLCLPAEYIAGKMMLVRALTLGWHIDVVKPKSKPLENVNQPYDFCAMTPFQLERSLSKVHLLSTLIVGGGAISLPLKNKLQGFDTSIYETYGMTETVTHIAVRRVNPKEGIASAIPFTTLSNVRLEQDKRGCLVINAPAVSKEVVVTNDLVKLLNDTQFMWLGRVDNVINSGGVKLYPERIEYKLGAIIKTNFFIAGIQDDLLGERVALFVEQEETFSINSKTEFGEVLDAYEIPKSIYILARFERTPNGKIQRKQTIKTALNQKR